MWHNSKLTRGRKKARKLWSYYYRKNKYQKAIECYTKKILLPPSRHCEKNHYNMSECYYYLGQFEKSLEYINKALDISTADIDCMELKRDTLYKLGEMKQVETMEKQIQAINDEIDNTALDLEWYYNS